MKGTEGMEGTEGMKSTEWMKGTEGMEGTGGCGEVQRYGRGDKVVCCQHVPDGNFLNAWVLVVAWVGSGSRRIRAIAHLCAIYSHLNRASMRDSPSGLARVKKIDPSSTIAASRPLCFLSLSLAANYTRGSACGFLCFMDVLHGKVNWNCVIAWLEQIRWY